MRILNTITIYDLTNLGKAFFAIGIVATFLFMIVTICKDKPRFALACFALLISMFIFSKVAQYVYVPVLCREYKQYEAIILSDRVQEALEQYDIIDRRGEIYILEDRK